MHVTNLTVGSRGDVQPYLALAGGLRQAGYQVRVATHRPFQAEIHRRGLEFRPVAGNPRQLLESEAGLAWLEAGRNPCAAPAGCSSSPDPMSPACWLMRSPPAGTPRPSSTHRWAWPASAQTLQLATGESV